MVNSTLEHLDLAFTQIDTHGKSKLATVLKSNTSLVGFSFGLNQLAGSISELAACIKDNSALERLDLEGNPISFEDSEEIAVALKVKLYIGLT